MNLSLDLHGNIALEEYFPAARQRTLQVLPEGGFFDHKDFRSASRRARPGDFILIPAGAFPASDFHQSLEVAAVRGGETALIAEKDPLILSADVLFFHGITFGSEAGPPRKILIQKGLVIFMDCHIHGEVEVTGASTEIALSRCALVGGKTGLLLKPGASAILHGTAFTGYQTGLCAEDGSELDIRYCRFAESHSASSNPPGTGVEANRSAVKITGSRFIGNDIALTLRHPRQTQILNSSFGGQTLGGIRIEENSADARALIRNCKFQRQHPSGQAQITLTQAHVEIENCEFAGVPGTEVSSLDGEVQFSHCVIQGEIQENGRPLDWPSAPNFQNCRRLSDLPIVFSDPEPLNFFLTKLHGLAGLSQVKPPVEQLLRELQARFTGHASAPPTDLTPYRIMMAGDTGSGRSTITRLLTEALVRYGVLTQSHTVQCSLHDLARYDEQGLRLLAESARGGVLLIRRAGPPVPAPLNHQRQLVADRRLKLKRLDDLIGNRGAIIVHGDRTMLKQLLSGDEPLQQIFSLYYHFPPYTAAKLATIVIRLCQAQQIEVPDESALKLAVGFHVTKHHKDRRYQNAQGAEALFQICLARYSERVNREGSADRQLQPADIVFPYERPIAEILTLSPGFVAKCPHCESLNPWQAGLPERLLCQDCGNFFEPETGTWLDRQFVPSMEDEPPQPEPRQRFTHRRITDIT